MEYYNTYDIKFIQSFRMRILKKLYNHMMDEKDVLASLEVSEDNYKKNKVYLDYLEYEGLVNRENPYQISKPSHTEYNITAKGINTIEKYMIDNEEYLKTNGYTAFDLDEFNVFVRED